MLLTEGAGPSARDTFLSELGAAQLYLNWRKANPGEAARFDEAVSDGSAPQMLTAFGRALVVAVNNFTQERYLSDNLTTTTTVSTIPSGTVVATEDLSLVGGAGHAQKTVTLSPRYVCTGMSVNISVTNSVAIYSGAGLTIPANTTHMLLSVETNSVRVREDGTSPTSTNGFILTAGDLIELSVPTTASDLRFIGYGGTAVLNISYRSYR